MASALPCRFPRLNAAWWDLQYRAGRWARLDLGTADGRELAQVIGQYAPRASILDLGCGTTANLPLTPGECRQYHGVDISAAAIGQARLSGRRNATYEVADILTYEPREHYDAILLREVIYYLPLAKVSGLLERLSGYLMRPGGMILVQVWAGEQKPGLTAAITASGLPVIAERTLGPGRGRPVVYLLGKPCGEGAGSVLDGHDRATIGTATGTSLAKPLLRQPTGRSVGRSRAPN